MHSRLTLPGLLLLATGCPSAPKPQAPNINLSRFESCSDLKSYVVDSTMEVLVNQTYAYDLPMVSEDSGSADSSGPSSVSITNVQVASVDVPDLV